MKKVNYMILGLAVCFCLSACQDDIEIPTLPEDVYATSDSTAVGDDCIVIEIAEGKAATRTAYSGLSSTMETGDQIGIYAWNGTTPVASNIRFTRQSNGSWAPASNVPYNASYTYCAYFPYRSDHGYTPATSGTVDVRFATFISDANNKFWTTDQSSKANFTSANLCIGQGTHVGSGRRVTFTLDHKRGLAVFTGDAVDAIFTGNQPYTIDTQRYFLMKPSTSTLFTDDIETYSLSALAGKYVSKAIKLPIDLSKVDNAGVKRSYGYMTTANCYLVHAAGDYKLPLVYGNAIKNNSVNTDAFYPNTSGQLTRFVNHAGNGITKPWITKSTAIYGVDGGMGLTAASAELLWQDVKGLISTVSVDGDYLKFTVGTFNPGNALIAVKDDSGTILWSWHIWATNETLTSTTAIATGSHTYNVAPVNLGWVPTGGDGKQGYCTYYQWGRKDPFIPCPGTTGYGSTKTVYNINGTSVTGLTNQESTTATIADNIKNPTCHYYNSSTGGSVTTTYYNMWDAKRNASSHNVTTATKKTIYDPCPPGFCVPTCNLLLYMANGSSSKPYSASTRSDSNWDSTNKGKTWTLNGASIYFPAVGGRDEESRLTNVGTYSYIWSASACSTNESRYLRIKSSGWEWSFYPDDCKAWEYAVRPVVEE